MLRVTTENRTHRRRSSYMDSLDSTSCMLTGVRMGRYQMSAQDQDTEHPEYGTPYTLYREASVHVSPPLSISISGRDCLPYGLAANLIWSCLLWVVGSVGLFSVLSREHASLFCCSYR